MLSCGKNNGAMRAHTGSCELVEDSKFSSLGQARLQNKKDDDQGFKRYETKKKVGG